jgi:hypothetical protein
MSIVPPGVKSRRSIRGIERHWAAHIAEPDKPDFVSHSFLLNDAGSLPVSPPSALGRNGDTGIALEQLDQGLRVLVGAVLVDHHLE